MVIYARPAVPFFKDMQSPIVLQLCVARIAPNVPPPSVVRLPRPDDPTPRRPPLVFAKSSGKRARPRDQESRLASLASIDKGKGKQGKSTDATSPPSGSIPGGIRTKGKVANVARLGSGVRLGNEPVFKVPALPAPRKTAPGDGNSASQANAADEIEKANKTVRVFVILQTQRCPCSHGKAVRQLIKKTAVSQLAACGVSRTHPEFTDLYGHVYRGAAFALVSASCRTFSPITSPFFFPAHNR